MIKIHNLACTAGDFRLGKLSFSVHGGEYFGILGPTGAGKTLLLESMAGLHRNPPESVWMDGQDVSRWMPEERNIGYVPQDCVLFPFLSVKENILFPLQVRGTRNREAVSHFQEIVNLLKIDHLLGRGIRQLSGGEKQRVALARALVIRPTLLLLDEPFAALHAGFRRKLWMEMVLLHKRLKTTVIHVTHDLEEACTLFERAAVLIDGKVEQISSRHEILQKPHNEKVAAFLGIMNVFDGRVTKIDPLSSTVSIHCMDYEFRAPLRESLSVGDEVRFCVDAERITIAADESGCATRGDETRLHADLVVGASHGTARVFYFKLRHSSCTCAEYDLEVRLPVAPEEALTLSEGQEATIVIRKDAIHVFNQRPPSRPDVRDLT